MYCHFCSHKRKTVLLVQSDAGLERKKLSKGVCVRVIAFLPMQYLDSEVCVYQFAQQKRTGPDSLISSLVLVREVSVHHAVVKVAFFPVRRRSPASKLLRVVREPQLFALPHACIADTWNQTVLAFRSISVRHSPPSSSAFPFFYDIMGFTMEAFKAFSALAIINNAARNRHDQRSQRKNHSLDQSDGVSRPLSLLPSRHTLQPKCKKEHRLTVTPCHQSVRKRDIILLVLLQ